MNMQNKIAAQVAGKPIMESEIDETLMKMGQRGQSYNNPQGRAMILDRLIAQKLFLLDAQKNLYEREPAFKEQLQKVKEDMLTNYAISKAVDNVRVKDEEVKKYFDENTDKFKADVVYNANHILVDSEEKAKELSDKIKAGDISFETAAREHSTCPSGQTGGDLGDFGKGQMVPEFEKACDDMEVGAISDPVKTQFGWHVIRLNKKGTGDPVSFDDVKNDIKEALLAQKQQAAYQSKVNQLKILFPVDKF